MDPLTPSSQVITDAVQKSRWLKDLLDTVVKTMITTTLDLAAQRHATTIHMAMATRLVRDNLHLHHLHIPQLALEHCTTVVETLEAEGHPAHPRLVQVLDTLTAMDKARQQAPDQDNMPLTGDHLEQNGTIRFTCQTDPADIPGEDPPV
jgi:hypothetical protein